MWKRRRISSLSGLFYRNPAAVTGVMLAPLVVVCTSLQTAAALSLVFLVLSVPVQLAAGLGGRYLPKPLWLPAMLVLSAVLLYPCLLYTSPV